MRYKKKEMIVELFYILLYIYASLSYFVSLF